MDAANEKGSTALMFAAMEGHSTIVEVRSSCKSNKNCIHGNLLDQLLIMNLSIHNCFCKTFIWGS